MKPAHWTEADILNAYAGGPREREAALQYIYLHAGWKPWVVQHVLHNSGDENDAHLVFQEAVVGLNRSLSQGTFKGDSSLRHYFNRIATFCWLKELEKRRRHSTGDLDVPGRQVADPGADLEKLLLDRERQNRLARVVEDATGDRCRDILLAFNQGASMEELAEEFGFSSPDMAKKQKYRCWQRLLDYLRERPELKEDLR